MLLFVLDAMTGTGWNQESEAATNLPLDWAEQRKALSFS